MNRREFCLTIGLLLAGHVCDGAETAHAKACLKDFRAEKVFLESRDTEIVRNRLKEIRGDGCDAVLLIPGRCSASKWPEQIEAEANRLELRVFVPACLSVDLFHRVRAVRHFDDGGILLLDGLSGVLGLILYERSRCRWTGFVPSNVGCVRGSVPSENISPMDVARWLDRQIGSLPRGPERNHCAFNTVAKQTR